MSGSHRSPQDSHFFRNSSSSEQVLIRGMTAMWVTLITCSRIISNRWYVPCSLYQTCLVWHHGSVFASNFLGELYKLLGIKRKMSTAFHPQTDGQTEQLNREINQYLRTYVNDQQNDWAKWIKIAQFIWNNTVSEITTDSLFVPGIIPLIWVWNPQIQ